MQDKIKRKIQHKIESIENNGHHNIWNTTSFVTI